MTKPHPEKMLSKDDIIKLLDLFTSSPSARITHIQDWPILTGLSHGTHGVTVSDVAQALLNNQYFSTLELRRSTVGRPEKDVMKELLTLNSYAGLLNEAREDLKRTRNSTYQHALSSSSRFFTDSKSESIFNPQKTSKKH